MRLDELVDTLVQPQQDQQVKIQVGDHLVDFKTQRTHESGYFILIPQETPNV